MVRWEPWSTPDIPRELNTPPTKEYTLNGTGVPNMIQAKFLKGYSISHIRDPSTIKCIFLNWGGGIGHFGSLRGFGVSLHCQENEVATSWPQDFKLFDVQAPIVPPQIIHPIHCLGILNMRGVVNVRMRGP